MSSRSSTRSRRNHPATTSYGPGGYYHGGVANASAYQLEISAFGYNPGDQAFERAYPWEGFRIGVIGTP